MQAEGREVLYAHTPGGDGTWHRLDQHLIAVAELARELAAPFGGGDLAYWAGLWHDLGKCNPVFQAYLQAEHEGRSHPGAPHAIWGSALVYRLLTRAGVGGDWKRVALPIQGHHAGLPNGGTAGQTIEAFLDEHPDLVQVLRQHLRTLPPPPTPTASRRSATADELFIRMVFSALVDADFRDTERHFRPGRSRARFGWPRLATLWRRLEQHHAVLTQGAPRTAMNQLRAEVYDACLTAAEQPPGLYRLTVPTGGGKTLSGLAFALQHALAHALRRVVVAIPYTSIIDQTAGVYRAVLGDAAVLEHHSQIDVPDDELHARRYARERLASENWEAPLIVTTTVQLFESLFANRPGRARKLHNLVRSVIVLDEIQTLPPGLLTPTLDVLHELVHTYGATVVLSTATQPALDALPQPAPSCGIVTREIVPQFARHFDVARRVHYRLHPEPITWDTLAEQVRGKAQVLVILNARKDALAVLDQLRADDAVFHLSTLLCGAHRRVVLDEVRRRLQEDRPVRLISTQVVEAGVDLDFPEVWRAVGPLDRIVQAAGRCNREGRRAQPGDVVIFEPLAGRAPRGPYRVGMLEAAAMLRRHGADELHQPTLYHRYFRRLFGLADLDAKHIQPRREVLDYPGVAREYRLIEEDTVPVVVPYGDWAAALEQWRADPSRVAWQRVQPFLVSIASREAARPEIAARLEPVGPGLHRWTGPYDERRGVATVVADPSDLDVAAG